MDFLFYCCYFIVLFVILHHIHQLFIYFFYGKGGNSSATDAIVKEKRVFHFIQDTISVLEEQPLVLCNGPFSYRIIRINFGTTIPEAVLANPYVIIGYNGGKEFQEIVIFCKRISRSVRLIFDKNRSSIEYHERNYSCTLKAKDVERARYILKIVEDRILVRP